MGDNSRTQPSRRSHAESDPARRAAKAEKIIAILSLFGRLEGSRVLEVGCGSGFIAARLAEQVTPAGSVEAVDVVDERQARQGFGFHLVSGTQLPFEGESFEFVVSNHVLEHVGSRQDQVHHLAELIRVLAPGGFCYLAVPNRWSLVEPHYRLPLLGWFGQPLADRYVRLLEKGDWYDVNPPSRKRLLRMFDELGLTAHDMTITGMRSMATIEDVSGPKRSVLTAPEWVIRSVSPIIPTMIYVLERGRNRTNT